MGVAKGEKFLIPATRTIKEAVRRYNEDKNDEAK